MSLRGRLTVGITVIKSGLFTTSHQSEWPSLKNLQIIHAEEGVEKREASYTVGGNVNWYNHYGEPYIEVAKKLKI